MGPIITEAVKYHPQVSDPGRRGDSGSQDRKTNRLLDPVACPEDGLRFFPCQGKAGFTKSSSNPRQHGSHLNPDLGEVPARKQEGEVVGVRYRTPCPAHIQLGEESVVDGVPQEWS